MKIENPYPKADCRIIADIETEPFNYFFRGALAGQRGPREAMVAIFFKAIYEACLEQKIPAHFELDNEHRIAKLLSRLNFTDVGELRDQLRAAACLAPTNSPTSPTPIPSDKPRAGRGNGPRRPAKVRAGTTPASTVSGNAGG